MRSADYIMSIVAKKNQMNVVVLDKKRIKEGTFQSLGHLGANSGQANKTNEYKKFFDELVRTKSLHRVVKMLQQRDKNKKHLLYFPFCSKRREEALEYVHHFKVPLQKAIWYLKMGQFANAAIAGPTGTTQQQQRQLQSAQQKQAKAGGGGVGGGWELHAMDLTRVLTKYLRDMMRKLDSTSGQAPESQPSLQRWPYFAALYKHCYEEGCVDRMEFLSELVDLLVEYNMHQWERPHLFRLFVVFMAQFTPEITQNAWLARKVAYVLCRRLWILKAEYDSRLG